MFSVSPPAVLWAQRNSVIYLTICIEDCREPVIQINPSNLYFKGIGGPDRKNYEINIDFYKDIISEQSKYLQTGRTIDFVLKKKEDGPFWPHLTKLKQRYHWLKVNFNKWKEEDDSDLELEQEDNFEEMMRSMGDLGTGDRPNFDHDSDSDDVEKDDEELPPLE
ncbi:hypothetical protein V9T40_008051 [Parthenolecanium corni]|uniref:CS domain-containing protein n=1 Tax=Parthenolecanium corni TaxID=536013 RepID=A0AAN9Y990_9HEMI